MAMNGNDIQRFIGINFGRYLWDKEYAFDPARFSNPQLRIGLDINAGGNTGTHNKIACYASLFEERPGLLKGFLMAKEIKQYTMASATHDYTDLPLDHRYRGLYFRPFLLGTEPCQAVTNIKLSEDQDKRIPFDLPGADIFRILQADLPICEEMYYFTLGAANKYIYCAPSSRVTGFSQAWGEAVADHRGAIYDGDGGRLKTIAYAAPWNAQVLIKGYVPHAVYQIPFGDKMDPSDWYDVGMLGSLKLDITGAAAAKGFIFLQQERLY